MKDLVYLTLTRNYDTICECIVLKDKINDATAELISQNKSFNKNFNLYVNSVELSVCGILIKGEFQYEINLSQLI